jgi:hypothetical protein
MEDVLEVYSRPYDARQPVVCLDETCKQMVGEVAPPIPAAPGHPALLDHEYVRNGVAEIFLEVEPLAGRRHVEVGVRRGRREWADFVRGMLEERYPDAKKVVLVMDNLNTHGATSLYERFPPEVARRLAERLEIHYTPKHGSWLDIAEIELSVLSRQCLNRRLDSLDALKREVGEWLRDRNNRQTKVEWHFTAADARVKLRRLYPLL